MKKEDFKVGKRYRVEGDERVYTCVGITLEGFPIMQIEDQHPFRAECPDLWVEYREPREFFVCFWHNNVVSVRRTEPPETNRSLYTDVIKMREVLD